MFIWEYVSFRSIRLQDMYVQYISILYVDMTHLSIYVFCFFQIWKGPIWVAYKLKAKQNKKQRISRKRSQLIGRENKKYEIAKRKRVK